MKEYYRTYVKLTEEDIFEDFTFQLHSHYMFEHINIDDKFQALFDVYYKHEYIGFITIIGHITDIVKAIMTPFGISNSRKPKLSELACNIVISIDESFKTIKDVRTELNYLLEQHLKEKEQ